MFLRHAHDPSHPSTRLWMIAKQAERLSVRSLQRLPVMSLAMQGGFAEDKVSLEEALVALEKDIATKSTV